ncbi:hypothetical protein R3P38DRAFT_2432638, partial [Favolaschia claudopus]
AHGLSATSPSSEMWALLYAKFMRTSEALKGLAIDKLRFVKLTDTRYLPEHLDTLTTLRGEALSIGANCSDLEFMPIILASKEFAQSVLMWQGSDQPGALSSALMHYWELTYKADMEKTAKEKEGGGVANAMAAAVIAGFAIAPTLSCRGGGKEGQAPGWWKAPKGLEPREQLASISKAKADVKAAAASTGTTPKAHHPAPAAAAATSQFVSAMDYFDL